VIPEAARNRNRYTIAAAAVIAAAGIALASFAFVAGPVRTVTSTTTVAQTVTVTATVNQTVMQSLNSLQIDCLENPAVNNALATDYPELAVSGSSTALLCVRVYYFNSTNAIDYNFTKSLGIAGFKYPPNAQPIGFGGEANFTVTPTQDEITLGGPSNENEGAVIGWAISAQPGASGSYELDFGAQVIDLFGPHDALDCGSYGTLAAGNGEPSYLLQGFVGCISYGNGGNSANQTNWPVQFGDSIENETLNSGEVYFVLAAWTNSPFG